MYLEIIILAAGGHIEIVLNHQLGCLLDFISHSQAEEFLLEELTVSPLGGAN